MYVDIMNCAQVECHVIRIQTDSIGCFYGFKVKTECLNWFLTQSWLALKALCGKLTRPVLHILYRCKPYAIYLTYVFGRVFKIIFQCILRNNLLTSLLKVERIESKHTALVGIMRIFLAFPYSLVTVCRLPSILMSTLRLVYS